MFQPKGLLKKKKKEVRPIISKVGCKCAEIIALKAKVADLEQSIYSVQTDNELEKSNKGGGDLEFLREIRDKLNSDDPIQTEYALEMISHWIEELEELDVDQD